jgi:hypothetical protein
MGDGNIQGKGNADGYNKNIYMFTVKEDSIVTRQPSTATTV